MEEPQKKKIVIVEDNEPLAEIYKTRIELLGYQCYVAYDGITALYLIQTELPQLVLLDLMVPNIAGDEILKRMRASKWGKDIPVFIISNLSESDAPAGLRDYNIMGYVVKANLADDGLDKIVNSILRPLDNPQPSATATEPITVAPEPLTGAGDIPSPAVQSQQPIQVPPVLTTPIQPGPPVVPPQI